MKRNSYFKLCNPKLSEQNNVDRQKIIRDYFGEIGDTCSSTFKLSGDNSPHFAKLQKFIYVELLLTVAYEIYERDFTIDECLLIFSGLHNTFLQDIDECKNQYIIQAHSFLSSFANENERRNYIKNFYFNQKNSVVKSSMLFEMCEGQLIRKKNQCIPYYRDREIHYKTIIQQQALKTLTSNNKQEGLLNPLITKRIYEKSPDHEASKIKDKLSLMYQVQDCLNQIPDEFIAKMDEQLIKQGKEPYYLKNFKKLRVEYLDTTMRPLIHIAAPTGVGKSVLFDVYIKRLTEAGLKVLSIATNHDPNGINAKLKYESLDIKTTLIMGKNRQKHINRFITSHPELSVPEIILKYPDLFDNIDYTCSHVTLNKNNEEIRHQCRKCSINLLDENTSSGQCSFYNMYKRLEDTQLVITTPHNLFKGSLGEKLDYADRSIYEVLSLWADVIFLDEVDQLQEISESAFTDVVNVYSLDAPYYSKNGNVEDFLNLVNRHIKRMDVHKDERILNFKTSVANYEKEVDALVRAFWNENSPKNWIGDWVGEKDFSIDYLIYSWCDTFISSIQTSSKESMSKKEFTARLQFLLKYKIKSIRRNILRDFVDDVLDTQIRVDESDDMDVSSDDIILRLLKSTYQKFRLDMLEQFSTKDLDDYYDKEFFTTEKLKINLKHNINYEDFYYRIGFILLLSSLNDYLENMYNDFPQVLALIDGESNRGFVNMASDPSKFILGVPPVLPTISNFRIECSYSGTYLTKRLYTGIGREMLFNLPLATSSFYNITSPVMFLTSATGTSTNSSNFTIKEPANTLLKRDDFEASKVNIKCHVFYNQLGEKLLPIRVSGLPDSQQVVALEQLTIYVIEHIIRPGLSEGKRFLVCTSSYRKVSKILSKLLTQGIVAKGLYEKGADGMPVYNSNIHISKIDIESKAIEVPVFVAVYDVISRGYNMVDKEGKSIFRDIIMMNRQMPVPDDILDKVSYLHKHIAPPSEYSAEAYNNMKKRMFMTNASLRHVHSFSSAPKDIKQAIAGNTFTKMKQLVGRGQRGGTEATLHLVDSAYFPNTADISTEATDKPSTSILLAWQEIANNSDPVTQYLYGDIKWGLNNYEFIRYIED